MRKLLTLLPVAALALAAACQDQPSAVRMPDNPTTPDAPELARVTGAAFTTDNPDADDPRGCVHGNLSNPSPAVNCNLFNSKKKVWINGGPRQVGPSALTEGIYFFAILEPGGQGGNNNPNDNTPKNLSDKNSLGGKSNTNECATGTGCGDEYTNRRFRVGAKGDIVEFLGTAGSHRTSTAFQTTNGLMIAPYYFDDTSNNGGVYILAICRLGDVGGPETYPVEPSNCKYDAFKVYEGSGPPPPLDVIISIEPDATNGITEPHTFTITATALGGTPNPDPTASPKYDFTITTKLDREPDSQSSTCDNPTAENDVTVTCTLTINSNSAGTFVANAKVTVTDYTTPTAQTANAETNGENGSSGPATKVYVPASLSWEKVDDGNPAKHLAGATFKIERTHDRFGNPLTPSDPTITGVTDCTSTPCPGRDKDARAGYFLVEDLPFGTWRITETQAPTGYNLANPAFQDITITDLENPTGNVMLPFVNPGKYSGETATGGGYPWSATTGAPSNWFMYSPWTSTPFGNLAKLSGPFNIGLVAGNVPLIAGQQYIAGTIAVTRGTGNNSTSITVTLVNSFRFAGASNNVKINPMLCTKSQKYMQPGQFSVKRSATVTQNSITVTGLSNTECYGIHVDVERPLFPI